MRGRIPDIFLGFDFQKDRLETVGAVGGVEILAFPLTRHIAYRTACCDRTSRDPYSIALDALQVTSETVLQAITCTGTDNENQQQNQSNQHKYYDTKYENILPTCAQT